MRKLTILALLWPALATAHGGDPLVVDIFFPTETADDLWIVVNNRGLFAREAGRFRWLCDESIIPEPGLGGVRIAAADGSVLVATGGSGVYRSPDAGCTWSLVPGGLTDHVSSTLLPHPARPSELLTVTETLGVPNDVFISEDGGQSWAAAGIASMGRVRSILRAPADPEVIYVTHFDGASRSDDGGRSFVPVALGPEGMDVRPEEFEVLVGHPLAASTVYATVARFPDSTLVRSDDGGEGWTEVVTLPDTPSSMALDESGERILLATPFEGLYRSDDGGGSWAQLPEASPGNVVGCLRSDPAGDRVWACGRAVVPGASAWAVGSTGDFGETWRPELEGFAVEAEFWDCPAESRSAHLCTEICIPEDPACVTLPDAGLADAGPPPDAAPDAAPGGGGGGDCSQTPVRRGAWATFWLLGLLRRRQQ